MTAIVGRDAGVVVAAVAVVAVVRVGGCVVVAEKVHQAAMGLVPVMLLVADHLVEVPRAPIVVVVGWSAAKLESLSIEMDPGHYCCR